MDFYERDETALQGEKDALDKQENAFGVNADMLYLLGGTTQVRILPPYSAKGVFFKEISKHRIKSGKRWETYACPREMAQQPCALCALGEELTASLDEAKIEYASKTLRPQTKYLYNVICLGGPQNRKNETPEFGKVYCLEGGTMVHKGIIRLDQDPADGWADITTVNNGVNLSIKRTGQGLGTEYSVSPKAERTDIFAQLSARGIDPAGLVLFDLDNVYELPTEEKLEMAAKLVAASAPRVAPVQALPIPVQAPPAAAQAIPVAAAPVAVPGQAAAAASVATAAASVAQPAAPVSAAPVQALPIAAAAPAEEVPAPPVIPAPPTE
jgi:hypothetical protein